jgi:RNA-directed DNA polymerase
LLEFGRFAARQRARRGEGKPETFDFLGLTHICGTKKNGQGFQLRRKTQRKRRMAKLTALTEELRGRRHQTIREQGQWLSAVLKGYYAYFAVPTNIASLYAMRHHVKVRWRMALQRRSQRQRMGWRRMERLADLYLPQPSILHPWPEQRFLVKHPR